MKMPFFYDVISSKFACGFFRLAILKFKLLTCNYNLRLGTTFDIDFSHRTGGVGVDQIFPEWRSNWGVVGPVIIRKPNPLACNYNSPIRYNF